MKNKENMVFVHTFIVPGKPDVLRIKYHTYLMFLSFLSIRKLYPDVPFYLVTDSKSYHYVKDFPYTEILTELDNYPKSLKPSFSKLHSIDIFSGQKMVHFDNDVFVFNPLPDFNDVIVQSLESNFIEFFWHCRLKHHSWIFPDFAEQIRFNYNPGVFGFTPDSIIRRDYYNLAVEYHDKNKAMLAAMPDGAEKSIMVDNLQDIFAFIEEGLLRHFIELKRPDLALVVPNKHADDVAWGSKDKGFSDFSVEKLDHAHYHAPHCEDYVHLMGWSTSRYDYTQQVINRVYQQNKGVIDEYFNIEV